MRKILLIVLGTVLTVSASVTVTENTSRRLSFTFTMEDFSHSSCLTGEHAYSRISFKEANCRLYGDGAVSLPSYSFFVGIPQSGKIAVRFVSREVKRVVLDYPLYPDSAGFNSFENVTPPFVNPWVSQTIYMHQRRMRTGHLFIRPFIYDPNTRVLTVLLKGSCTIEFPAAGGRMVSSRTLHGDYYAMLQDKVMNFNVAKRWMKPGKRAFSRRENQGLLPADEKMLRFTIGDGFGGIKEATTDENGIIKIKGSDIASFFGSAIRVNDIALFGSPRGELGDTVPTPGTIPDGVSAIPLYRVDLNGNTLFDSDDYILAYVTGIGDWYYDTAEDDFGFEFNRVENYRHYWLRVNGPTKTITQFSCTGTPIATKTMFEDRIRYKKSKYLMSDTEGKGGIEWIWKTLTKSSPSFSHTFSLPDANTLYPGAVRINYGAHTSSFNDSIMFGDIVLPDSADWMPFSNWNDSVQTITVALFNPGDNTYLDVQSIDIKYQRDLDMKDRTTMRVFSPLQPDSAIVSYHLANLPVEKSYIFRISSDEQQVDLIAAVSSGGTYAWVDTAGIGIQYFFCTESGLLGTPQMESYLPSTEGTYEIKDLRRSSNRCDYLIITHSAFMSEAKRLAAHKKEFVEKFSYPRIVYIDDIFREFSGGNQDPSAIRNFLFYAANFWTPVSTGADPGPDYVLLLGNGHYDYKGYKTREINFIPTVQIKLQSAFKCIEDFYSCIDSGHVLNNDIAPHLFLGRIPCLTTTEAGNVVDKIIDMEGPEAEWGAWRNRLLLVSDDDMQGSGKDFIQHYIDNEDIEVAVRAQRPATEIRKVVMFEYEWNELYQKPEASAALFNEINNGVGYVNYFGHGNAQAWADEGILNKDMMGNFKNYKRYPVINSFSCSVGYFDKPDMTCLSGLMMTTPRAGAIAAVASARTAFATKNAYMSKEFFRILYEQGTSWTLGQTYAMTKIDQNLKHYVLLGDPSIQFMNLTDSVVVDIYEDGIITDDTLMALETITVKGTIKRNNTTNVSFGTPDKPAEIQIGLYNPLQDSVKRKDGGTFTNPEPVYTLPGTPVFVGKTEVTQGTFEQKILLPRNVTFLKPGVTLRVYAFNDGSMFAVGHKGNMIFKGSGVNPITDNEGPRICVRPVYDNDSMWNTSVGFTDKISSFLPLNCEISVWDEHGIDVSGIGPDEGLTVNIDGVIERQNINNSFKFDGGEYTKGRANIVFENNEMKPGVYDMTIRAQDQLGKVSKTVISLEILDEEDFKLGHVFNYPNPVRMGGRTKFYFYHSNTSEAWHGKVEATIKIYTLNGRLIYVKPNAWNGWKWDCTDQRGRRLSPNIYLYRVTAKMLNAGLSGNEKIIKSPVKKLVIHPPR